MVILGAAAKDDAAPQGLLPSEDHCCQAHVKDGAECGTGKGNTAEQHDDRITCAEAAEAVSRRKASALHFSASTGLWIK